LYRVPPNGFIEPCLPIPLAKPPTGPNWIHEIKHDGFTVIARKQGSRVKLYSRPDDDLTYRFPLIIEPLDQSVDFQLGDGCSGPVQYRGH
jgi:ATP-dependent DNA ligase